MAQMDILEAHQSILDAIGEEKASELFSALESSDERKFNGLMVTLEIEQKKQVMQAIRAILELQNAT
ncbi:MAG: hypothetical protein HQK60_03235 [Deltaproteobacteria bacterium]|nr:hypothetical protein [Deltaproteobacteria bacterium]